MYAFTHDLRFAFRQLRKAPGVSLTVVLTLALGIGATTAMFSLIEGILLRPLPFKDPDRLVLVGDHLGTSPSISVTAPEIEMYSKATSSPIMRFPAARLRKRFMEPALLREYSPRWM